MYLRFVIDKKDEDSGRRQGIFIAAAELRDSHQLYQYEEEQLKEIMTWFNANLDKPRKFSTAARANPQARAISWYKDTAKECITRMYDLKAFLESKGIRVDVIQTSNSGYIVYEDEHQVTAEPFKSTGA